MLNWKNLIKSILVLVVIEGALRKWLLPGASEFIYFLKDILLLLAYFQYYIFSPSKNTLQMKNTASGVLITCIAFVTVWCIFQVFNPNLGDPIIGIFGIRGYILYIPLLWMLPNLFSSEDELYRFLRSYLLLVIPVGILATLQFFSPPSSPINVYTQDLKLDDIATFGDGNSVSARVTGTFSYIAGYSIYAIVSFSLAVPLLAVKQTVWWRWATISELLLIVGTSLMNGSRGLIYTEILFLIGFFGIQLLTNPARIVPLFRRFTMPIIAVTAGIIIWFQSAFNALEKRIISNDDTPNRITLIFKEPLKFVGLKGIDSYGIGATHQATPALRSLLKLPTPETIPVFYESEPGRILLELGPVGFVLWYSLRFVLIVFLWSTYSNLKRPLLKQLALSAFLIHLLQFSFQLVFNHTLLVYYWFLAGFIFLLPKLEQIENWKKLELLDQYNASATYFPHTPYQ
jgi:hypothetical protein